MLQGQLRSTAANLLPANCSNPLLSPSQTTCRKYSPGERSRECFFAKGLEHARGCAAWQCDPERKPAGDGDPQTQWPPKDGVLKQKLRKRGHNASNAQSLH